MIRIANVTQHYGIRPVLQNLSLEIPSGSRTAVIGPNGTGKSTLLAVLAGVLSPQRGHVEINGLRRRSSIEAELAIRRQTVYLPDRSFLPKNRTGREFILAVGRLYEIESLQLFDHANRLLKLFNLLELADAPIRSYSAGQQKKIALCSALITEAPVLLLDEPYSGGLDPAGILALREVLKRLAEEQGHTIVLTSPVPELVTEIADQIIVLRDGQVAVAGSLAELQQVHGTDRSMDEILGEIIFPEATAQIDAYFQSGTT